MTWSKKIERSRSSANCFRASARTTAHRAHHVLAIAAQQLSKLSPFFDFMLKLSVPSSNHSCASQTNTQRKVFEKSEDRIDLCCMRETAS